MYNNLCHSLLILTINLNKMMYVIQEDDNHMYPLCYACEMNDIKEVKRMIYNGENINIQNDKLETPLHIACWKYSINIIEVLLKHGADPNKKDNFNNSPLHYVCMNIRVNYIHYNIVKLLLEYGADVDCKNDNGSIPLYITCYRNNSKAVELLLEKGANVNEKNNDGHAPLHCILHNFVDYHEEFHIYDHDDERLESIKIIKLLFDYRANIYSKNEYNKGASAILEKEMKKRIYILSLIINGDVLKHYIAKKIY